MLPTRTKGYMTSLRKSKSYKEFKDLNPDIDITKLGYNKLKNPITDSKNKTRKAMPKSKPIKNFVDPKTGSTSGIRMPNFTSGKQNKMGGGQVMKYKKGGIVYKQGGGVIKANSGGQNIVDSGYTKV